MPMAVDHEPFANGPGSAVIRRLHQAAFGPLNPPAPFR
jgi:hypothetical protein